MQVTTLPALDDYIKARLRGWLITTLSSPELTNESSAFPASGLVTIYLDGVPSRLQAGHWQKTSQDLYLASTSDYLPISDRLAILLGITYFCEPSVELSSACSKAITTYLLGEYRALSSNLVNAVVPVEGLAFSTDNRVASLLGGEWMLPSGETVDVTGPEWTVCATEVPVVSPATEVVFNAGPSGPAFPPVESESHPINAEYQFALGQRVHWSSRHYGEHNGTITAVPTGDRGYYVLTDRENMEWAAMEAELRRLEDFTVGQRVHWTPGEGHDIDPGEGLITAFEPPYFRVQPTGSNFTYLAEVEELRAL